LSKFVLRMIARLRSDRPATTGEVVRRLTEFHDRLTRNPPPPPRRRSENRWLGKAAAVLAGAVGVAGVVTAIAYLERERSGRWPWEPRPAQTAPGPVYEKE